MSYEEDDPRDFLRRVVWTLSLGLVWLMSTIALGMYTGWMIPENGLRLANILFYIWMVGSLVGLIWINIKIWKKKFPHG